MCLHPRSFESRLHPAMLLSSCTTAAGAQSFVKYLTVFCSVTCYMAETWPHSGYPYKTDLSP